MLLNWLFIKTINILHIYALKYPNYDIRIKVNINKKFHILLAVTGHAGSNKVNPNSFVFFMCVCFFPVSFRNFLINYKIYLFLGTCKE
jgi:hypothetical protein